jgi:TRAP-type mannitol/chloroaromatic compound transport system substrate-binding protein
MKRREFVRGAVVTGPVAGAASSFPAPAISQGLREWRMVTTWPKNFPGLGTGAELLGKLVTDASDGRLKITVYGGGEIVPPFESMDAVSSGTVEMGHGAPYYWKGKVPASQCIASMPFGMTVQEQNAWFQYGGGQELADKVYAEMGAKFFLSGNTGVQMGGWFNKEINSVSDMPGLKMRIPGLGGQVMDKLGVTVQVLAGGEIFQALQTGAVDAAEWVGPYDDEKLGFHTVTKYYYYPGWWEPGPTLEVDINLEEWNKLPQEYQEAIKSAAFEANTIMMARYDAKNPAALARLLSESDIELRRYPDDVMQAAEEASFELYDQFATQDTDFGSVLKEWKVFRDAIQPWFGYAETAFLNFTSGQAG